MDASRSARAAFWFLRSTLAAGLAAAGADKLLHAVVGWDAYLATPIAGRLDQSAGSFVELAGVVELAIAAVVAVRPRPGAWLALAWFVAIAANLLIGGGAHVALVCPTVLGIAVAWALARSSERFDPCVCSESPCVCRSHDDGNPRRAATIH